MGKGLALAPYPGLHRSEPSSVKLVEGASAETLQEIPGGDTSVSSVLIAVHHSASQNNVHVCSILTKVCKLDDRGLVRRDEYVLWLDVAVADSKRVQLVEATENLTCVVTDGVFVRALPLLPTDGEGLV